MLFESFLFSDNNSRFSLSLCYMKGVNGTGHIINLWSLSILYLISQIQLPNPIYICCTGIIAIQIYFTVTDTARFTFGRIQCKTCPLMNGMQRKQHCKTIGTKGFNLFFD